MTNNSFDVHGLPKVGDTINGGAAGRTYEVTSVSISEELAPRQLKGPVGRVRINILASDAPGDDDNRQSPDIW